MLVFFLFFFFNDTATTEIYTLSLHDALPISEESKLVATFKPEDITALVKGMAGNAKNGAGIFLKQGCIACHAVSMDQIGRAHV